MKKDLLLVSALFASIPPDEKIYAVSGSSGRGKNKKAKAKKSTRASKAKKAAKKRPAKKKR